MLKGKTKKPAKTQRLTEIETELDGISEDLGRAAEAVSELNGRVSYQAMRINKLEDAICPRVAARLLALERKIGLAKPAGPKVVENVFGGRKPCTQQQIENVARDMHPVLAPDFPWSSLPESTKKRCYEKAHKIIHIVLHNMA